MNSPIEEIKKAVAENRTGNALSRLLELSQNNKQLHDAIHIVLAEFNDLTSQRLKGTIDNSEATRRLNVIHDCSLYCFIYLHWLSVLSENDKHGFFVMLETSVRSTRGKISEYAP